MVTPLARAAEKISIDPAGARCSRNVAPREGPRRKHLREEGLQRMPDGDIIFKAATERLTPGIFGIG
jgi:hypothetical protein